MPKILNKRKDNIPPDAVYVGRPSKWGNPFKIVLGHIGRDCAIADYETYILHSPDLLNDLHELKGKDLVCWCAPLPCHADILLELANT